ncbi:hypothetical protein AB0I81_22565 [Nonomuraea sp. NPDC050404]|uniref:hypothetical protein n=1 Tax=Nonomuraea sp. NPDC050404 TaxID=3155783 RepID=UPI0033C5529F
MNISDLETVTIVRAGDGRLATACLVLTSADADAVTDDMLTSADGAGEDMMLLRADGNRLVRVEVSVLPADADRIVAEALAVRAV